MCSSRKSESKDTTIFIESPGNYLVSLDVLVMPDKKDNPCGWSGTIHDFLSVQT
jgi:hypothetical protein